jgi:TPR repeat protein
MKKLFLCIICVFQSSIVIGQENKCIIEGKVRDYSQDHPLCLFFTGTEHFRNKEYLKASVKWQELISLPVVPKEYDSLVSDASNNLGYLYYHGLGVNPNMVRGLQFWRRASELGNSESEYHLCYAYGEKSSAVFSREDAKKHCDKAEFLYKNEKNIDQNALKMIRKVKNEL